MTAPRSAAELVHAIACTEDPAPLLDAVHGVALDSLGGRSSVLLRLMPPGRFEQVSASGTAGDGPLEWLESDSERALADKALSSDDPRLVLPPAAPALRRRLGGSAVVLIPLRRGDPRGLLVIALPTTKTPDDLATRSAALADACLLIFDRVDRAQNAEIAQNVDFLRQRLAQSEKLAALGQFVAGIAHELNNPLQGVLGHLELIRRTRPLPTDLSRDLRLVYREADRAARIIRNLLIFAGSRKLKQRRLRVNSVLSRALSLRSRALKMAGIDVIRTFDDQLAPIVGDPLLLQQAFLNIFINAEQAMIGGEVKRLEIRTSESATPGFVTITVRDTGPGIPPDVLPRIFEPFYSTKDVGKGTGLGLAIAYGVLQEHNGTIAAENDPKGGAVFIVQLPTAGKVVN